MTAARRKLVAIDDPLALRPAASEPGRPARGVSNRTAALYVQLPIAQSESLRRAAFELRVHKRVIVAALIAAYVETGSAARLASLEGTIDQYLGN